MDFLMWTQFFLNEAWFYIQWDYKLPPNNRYCCSNSLLAVPTTPLHSQVQLWCAMDTQYNREDAFQRNNKFLPPCSVNFDTVTQQINSLALELIAEYTQHKPGI